jgi:recombinational DNA repair protein RecT
MIKDDPLGECKVDLGLVDRDFESRIHGLIEVDVFNSWGETYPTYYTKFHVLERKLKYFQGTNYKYLTCTFNNTHDQMACTTRENIERCLEKYGVMDKFMTKINAYDRVVRCPLDENIFWFGVKDK